VEFHGNGLTNAPAAYQTLINRIFCPRLRDFISVYLDDVLVISNTLDEHYLAFASNIRLLWLNEICCKPSNVTALPVTNLTHHNSQFDLSNDCEHAFQTGFEIQKTKHNKNHGFFGFFGLVFISK
jgi:hypothetical protein